MNDSMAQPRAVATLELPGWKTAVGWVAALSIGLLFLASGLWKITGPRDAAVRMAQAKVPAALSLPAALAFGILETVGGVWILVPRLRRWGALTTGLLLAAFLVYVGVNYQALRGADCSCFPWIKRAVGPGFFIGDAVMLLLAVAAGAWGRARAPRRAADLRAAALVAGAVVILALGSYGVAAARETGVKAPASIVVDGKPYSLEQGNVFLFFFNPECMHCVEAARRMSHYHWAGTAVIGVPVEHPRFAPQFLAETGLRAGVSTEFDRLAAIFHYTAYPFGVALEHGREKASLTIFDEREPEASLRRLGLVD
ncbi:MAG: MauE/DoxX family redox-associated membrane protein [Bryobacteraceae bacterium]